MVAKLLAFAGFVPLCIFLLTIPPPPLSADWYNWLIEFFVRHTGGARETVALVIWRVLWAGVAVGAAGVLKEAWEEWEYSRKALVGALAAALAVIGLIAGGVVWWRYGSPLASWVQHPAPAGRYPVRAIPQSAWVPTPATLSDAFVILIVTLFGLFRMAGQSRMMGTQRNGVLAARRAGLGAACLAVLALVIVSSARDVGGVARLLQFAEQLFSTPQSWTLWATLGGLLALLLIGGVCLAVGLTGPFIRDGMQLAKDFAWFAAAAGLWAWGAFLPPDFGWFDEFGLPDGLRIFNFGALCWYLFTATESGVAFLLSLGIFSGRDPLGPFVGGGGPRPPVRGS